MADALGEGGFVGATPLWSHVLKEAEARADGGSPGIVTIRDLFRFAGLPVEPS